MIQRIQTIFLILVVTSMTTFLFVPHWSKVDNETGESHQMTAISYNVQESVAAEMETLFIPYAVAGLFGVLVIIVSVIEILKYNNRVLQMKLGMANSFLILFTLGASGWFWFSLGRTVLPYIPVGFGFGLLMPAFAMIFNRMALRFIKKDEDLVRSVDRIR